MDEHARHDDALYDVADGSVKVQTGPDEIQEDEEGNGAPNIFLQPAPEGTWEVTTKVNIAQTHEGQQAGLSCPTVGRNDIVKLATSRSRPARPGTSGSSS